MCGVGQFRELWEQLCLPAQKKKFCRPEAHLISTGMYMYIPVCMYIPKASNKKLKNKNLEGEDSR